MTCENGHIVFLFFFSICLEKIYQRYITVYIKKEKPFPINQTPAAGINILRAVRCYSERARRGNTFDCQIASMARYARLYTLLWRLIFFSLSLSISPRVLLDKRIHTRARGDQFFMRILFFLSLCCCRSQMGKYG